MMVMMCVMMMMIVVGITDHKCSVIPTCKMLNLDFSLSQMAAPPHIALPGFLPA